MAGKGDGCTYIFGIPIHETAKCRADRKAAQLKKQEENANYKLQKQKNRQEGHTDRTDIRNAEQASTNIARANAGLEPGADTAGAIGAGLGALAPVLQAALDPLSVLGLGSSASSTPTPAPSTGTDLAPIAIAAAAAVALLIWSSK